MSIASLLALCILVTRAVSLIIHPSLDNNVTIENLLDNKYLSSAQGASLMRNILPIDTTSVLSFGGAQNLGDWWREKFTVVHACMGDNYHNLTNHRDSTILIDWEPCRDKLSPLPFSRWAMDVAIIDGIKCIESVQDIQALALEIDRILRPKGTAIIFRRSARDGEMLDSTENRLINDLKSRLGWKLLTKLKCSVGGCVDFLSRPVYRENNLIKQCNLNSSRSFCELNDTNNLPLLPKEICVYDPPHATCPVIGNISRISPKIVTSIFPGKSIKLRTSTKLKLEALWKEHSWIQCAIPNSTIEARYLAFNNFKRYEFGCAEQRAVLGMLDGGVQNYDLSSVNRLPPKKCLNISDISNDKEEVVMRLLDAGGGSCSLFLYLRAQFSESLIFNKLQILGFDVGYSCAYLFKCSEMGAPALLQTWLKPIRVPNASFDMVVQSQGLHEIAPDDITTVLDHLTRPLRPGGWLHLSDGYAKGGGYESLNYRAMSNGSFSGIKCTKAHWHKEGCGPGWAVVALSWLRKRNYTLFRAEEAGHLMFLFQRPL